MWFPEIFERFSEFESKYPNKTSTVCTVSESASKNTSIYYYQECDPIIGDKVFVETFIIALSCMPTSISLGYLMEKLGKKIVLGKLKSLVISFFVNTFCSFKFNFVWMCNCIINLGSIYQPYINRIMCI